MPKGAASPWGVFGPGAGALTITKALHQAYPDLELLHYADTTNNPFGSRAPEEVCQFISAGVQFLLARGCRNIVLGCNTSSTQVATVRELLGRADVRVFSIIDLTVAGLSQLLPRNAVLHIVSTPLTAKSGAFTTLLARSRPEVKSEEVGIEGLAGAIDRRADRRTLRSLIEGALVQHPWKSRPDGVALCCTHYPLVEDEFRSALTARWGGQVVLYAQGAFACRALESVGDGASPDERRASTAVQIFTSQISADFSAWQREIFAV